MVLDRVHDSEPGSFMWGRGFARLSISYRLLGLLGERAAGHSHFKLAHYPGSNPVDSKPIPAYITKAIAEH